MGGKHRDGRISNPSCPRFGSRRQFVVGFSGLVGSLACGGSGQRSGVAGAGGAPSDGGSIGQSGGRSGQSGASSGRSGGAATSGGANTGGAGAGGTALGHGGVNAAGGMGATMRKAASDRVLL